MNVKNNRRRRESVSRIEKTFVELLQSKELSEITITDICQICGLNRTTFYASFTDIYDLADKIRLKMENEVKSLYAAENSEKFNSNDYLRLFQHIKDNQLFYRTYFKLGYDSQFKVIAYDTQQAQQHFDNQYIDYHIEFFRYGFNAVVKKWLAGGCQEPPEVIDEIIRSEYQGRE